MRPIFLLVMLLALAACGARMSADTEERIEILYAHTLQMQDYAASDNLQKIGINTAALNAPGTDSAEEKLVRLETAFSIEPKGTFENRITSLETRMAEIMARWNEIT